MLCTVSITKPRVCDTRPIFRHNPPPRFEISRTPHAENPRALIDTIHAKGMRAGIAISPDTPSTVITDDVGNAADLLLVMTVYPGMCVSVVCVCHMYRPFCSAAYLVWWTIGRGGQKFLERCVPKVAELRQRFPQKDIEVDGGVGPNTVDACTHAGKSGYFHDMVGFVQRGILFLSIYREQRHCRWNRHFQCTRSREGYSNTQSQRGCCASDVQ